MLDPRKWALDMLLRAAQKLHKSTAAFDRLLLSVHRKLREARTAATVRETNAAIDGMHRQIRGEKPYK